MNKVEASWLGLQTDTCLLGEVTTNSDDKNVESFWLRLDVYNESHVQVKWSKKEKNLLFPFCTCTLFTLSTVLLELKAKISLQLGVISNGC